MTSQTPRESFYRADLDAMLPAETAAMLRRPDVVLDYVEMQAASRVDWPDCMRWPPDTEEPR